MMKNKTLSLALALTLILPSAGAPQAPTQGAQAPQVGCLRGRPLPACTTFWIVEMQGSTPLAQTTRIVSYSGEYEQGSNALDQELEWNLGHMVNLSPTFALGGVLTLGNGNSDALTGVRLRARRWLGQDVSVELQAGLLRTTAGGATYPGIHGATTDVRLNIRDHGSFFVRWDGVDIPEKHGNVDWWFHDPGGFHHGVSVGASAGSVPALIGTGALGLGYVILLGLWAFD